MQRQMDRDLTLVNLWVKDIEKGEHSPASILSIQATLVGPGIADECCTMSLLEIPSKA